MKDKLLDLIKAGKVKLKDYVVIVPLELYEQLLDEAGVEENEHAEVYHNGVRIMWSKHVSKPILVTKEVYNQKYNPCGFIRLEVS